MSIDTEINIHNNSSLLQLNDSEEQDDSSSAPSTPAPTWSAERIVRLIEPWKKSLSQSAEHIPKARGWYFLHSNVL